MAGRALLAVGLFVGFYVLALGLVALLVYLPFEQLRLAHSFSYQVLAFCVTGIVAILSAIVPRWDRFEPPGPQLRDADHPELFREIRDIAGRTGQPMPKEVYLTGEVNAWAARRGGLMGIGSRPVMGLGFPLLQAVTVAQLRAILAHEYGHDSGGDTLLGRWVYRTRAGLERAVEELSGHRRTLQRPFVWYGRMFLRVSHAVSRRQELAADALAARVVGARAMSEALRTLEATRPAYRAYWSQEVTPAIQSGFLPPLAEGFGLFLASPQIAAGLWRYVEKVEADEQVNPFDTHPPLRERLAALRDAPPGEEGGNGARAISLLRDVTMLERRLLAQDNDRVTIDALRPIAWEDVGRDVWAPRWQRSLERNTVAFRNLRLGDLGDRARERSLYDRAAREGLPPGFGREETPDKIAWILGSAAASVLVRLGWEFDAAPGDEVRFRRGEAVLTPFQTLGAIASGRAVADTWLTACEASGVGAEAIAPPEAPRSS